MLAPSSREGLLKTRASEGDTHGFVPLEEHYSASLITSSKIVARLIEFDSRDDISYKPELVTVESPSYTKRIGQGRVN